MLRVGTTGAWVVVLVMTATLVEIVDMVVDVVELGKAGRPAVVPATEIKRVVTSLSRYTSQVGPLTFVQILGFAADFEDDFHVVRRASAADASV